MHHRQGGGLLIRAYAKPPELPVDFYETSLAELHNALTMVLVCNFEAKCGSTVQPPSQQQQQQQQQTKSSSQDVCMEDATTITALQQQQQQQQKRPHSKGREELYC